MMDVLVSILPVSRIGIMALVILVLELFFVSIWHRRTGRGIAFTDLVGSAFAGIFLLLALFAALSNAGWIWIVAALSVAFFCAHRGYPASLEKLNT